LVGSSVEGSDLVLGVVGVALRYRGSAGQRLGFEVPFAVILITRAVDPIVGRVEVS
jgi:hypothetical protein